MHIQGASIEDFINNRSLADSMRDEIQDMFCNITMTQNASFPCNESAVQVQFGPAMSFLVFIGYNQREFRFF